MFAVSSHRSGRERKHHISVRTCVKPRTQHHHFVTAKPSHRHVANSTTPSSPLLARSPRNAAAAFSRARPQQQPWYRGLNDASGATNNARGGPLQLPTSNCTDTSATLTCLPQQPPTVARPLPQHGSIAHAHTQNTHAVTTLWLPLPRTPHSHHPSQQTPHLASTCSYASTTHPPAVCSTATGGT